MKRLVLESIEGVEIYPIISLVLFMSMFTVVLIYVFRADKSFIKRMAALPVDDAEKDEEKGGLSHE